MPASQRIFKVRRYYNKWVANQTLEDYALRFTARSGRKMSIERVAQTALGATAFLALESISATVTLNYGFTNTLFAMLAVCVLFFITGFPIAYYSAKHGLDIDLLTRGAGFGYLGSTITSLIYASFTFIFFAIEAVILASALYALFGLPLAIGYFLCAVAVIPIVTHGISAISRFQTGTQVLWLLLQCSALVVVVLFESSQIPGWVNYAGQSMVSDNSALPAKDEFNLLYFGAAASVFFALVAQIGEQVDYLRFLPPKTTQNRTRWWFWLILAGPGWVFIGAIKMLLGSFLAYLAISQGTAFELATDPTHMYQRVFHYLTESHGISLVLAGAMVIVSQMKINVTNAYAGSIAWSNFFSRLTHSHPGRVVWLVFNVTIALLLMELGIYRALEAILGIFAIVAVSWLGSLAADLLINKPFGLSPSMVEFKRAHLYDINPVGTGSMLLATVAGVLSYLGQFGEVCQNLSHFLSLAICFLAVPLFAYLTKGRYYIARSSPELEPLLAIERNRPNVTQQSTTVYRLKCGICENPFEIEDMSFCPAYALPICSLCCTLDVRCLDSCKPQARGARQVVHFLALFMPSQWVRKVNSRLGRFIGLLLLVNLMNAALLAVVYRQMEPISDSELLLLEQVMWTLFFTLLIASGVISWLFLLAHESRVIAQKESNRQTRKLTREIDAHKETDLALQQAKELAERANAAKSRYLTGISHELRTPLQSVLGYAQLLRHKNTMPEEHKNGLDIIYRSGQYLTDLIEGLLDISRIEAGRLELYRSRVNLPELISQLEAMFSIQSQQKGITFVCHTRGIIPQWVMTDEKRLRQILINLLSNAVKYTAEGEVCFEVRYRNQVAEFKITDTGSGITQEDLKRIFDPFERVRNRATASLPGTGLGLTIVRLLTDIMGGDLQYESSIGQGSCFKVALMLPWVSVEKNVERDLPWSDFQDIVGYEGYQRTLFLVDDDPVLRGLLSDLLTPLGFITLEAHSGESCLSRLAESGVNRHPDLFLLDVSMPGMDGLTLAKKLRLQGVSVPIVMLSADAQERYRSSEEQSVYNDYLVKPISNTRLLQKLEELLALEWSWQKNTVHKIPLSEIKPLSPSLTPETNDPLPDHPLIYELRSFAEMGYRKGVQDTLRHLEQEQILTLSQLQSLQKLAGAFQYQLILDKITASLTASLKEIKYHDL